MVAQLRRYRRGTQRLFTATAGMVHRGAERVIQTALRGEQGGDPYHVDKIERDITTAKWALAAIFALLVAIFGEGLPGMRVRLMRDPWTGSRPSSASSRGWSALRSV
jgi:hypothetical protein